MKKGIKLLLAVLALAVALALVSCNGDEKPHTHTEEIIPAVESTCTKPGLTEGVKCSTCGEILVAQQEIPLKAHTEEVVIGIKATCTATGLSDGKKCSICDKILVVQQETPIIAHTYDDKYDESCNICGFFRDVECLHGEVEIIKGYQSTCNYTGLTDGEKCKKCGEILVSQVVIPLGNHTPVIDQAIEPTCTIMGFTEGKHCDICGIILIEQNKIPAKGHSFSEWIVIKEISESQDGVKERYCDCGAKESKYVKKIGISKPSEGLDFALNEDGKSYCVTWIGSCTDTDIVIPDVYQELPVTSIGYGAFCYNESISYIGIPSSIEEIGDWAFSCCQFLSEIEVHEDNEWYKSMDGSLYSKDGKVLFQYAIGKKEALFSIPNSVTHILDGAFADCALTDIIIPDSVTNIGEWAIWRSKSISNIQVDDKNNCYKSIDGNLYTKDEKTLCKYSIAKSDTSFEIPNTVTIIGATAFSYSLHLVDILIPNSVEDIKIEAFNECDSLTSVVIPDSVKTIGYSSFSNCSSLTNVTIGNSVETIGNHAFHNCASLKSIFIPDSVTSIGDNAFRGCTSLTSVVIPDSVTSIGDYAFYNCTSLTSIVIPDSVTSIGTQAFNCCDSLTRIEVDKDNKYYCSIDDNLYNKNATTLIQYAIGKTDTSFAIPDSVTSIGDYAFYNCTSLTSIVIPDSVTSIGYWAFSDCISLTSVVIPDSVTSIGDYAFYYCSKLTSIVIPDSVTSIGKGGFWKCDSLTSVEIPDSVTSIGSYAFAYCSKLTIYCEAESTPDGWHSSWNSSNRPVVWGYNKETVE